MGAWGHGTFDNDDAQDWLWLLEEDRDGSLLRDTLAAVAAAKRNDDVDAPEATRALAAAEVVAAAAGAAPADLPDEARIWLTAHGTAVEDDLADLARAAVSRVRADSELRDLWDEVGPADWLSVVDELAARLGAPSGPTAAQHAMNRRTWEVFRAQGLAEGAELRLDFFYAAGDKQPAHALAGYLRRETDYEVTVVTNDGGLFRKKTWSVEGRTPATPVSLPILDDWVDWLIQAGDAHGPCAFDGWGAPVP